MTKDTALAAIDFRLDKLREQLYWALPSSIEKDTRSRVDELETLRDYFEEKWSKSDE